MSDQCHFESEPSGAGLACLDDLRKAAVSVDPQYLGLDVELSEPLPRHGVVVESAVARHLDQARQVALDLRHRAERDPGALVHERRDRDHPAVPDAADDVLVGDARLLDEELVELGLSRDLDERAHLHRVLLHVHQEVGEALVLGHLGVGARHEHAPLGVVGEGGPHLLAGHHPLAVVLDRLGLQRREVGARVGLREPLAPDLLAREDRLDEALLLLLGPVGDDGRPAHGEPEDVRGRGGVRRGPSRS